MTTKKKAANGKKVARKKARKKVTRKKVAKRERHSKETDMYNFCHTHGQHGKCVKCEANSRRREKRRLGGAISTSKKRKSAGRPPFVPTDEQRKNVETLAGLGLRLEDIVLLVENPTTGEPITERTLSRHFALELKRGKPKVDAQVIQSLVKKAIGDSAQAVAAAQFYLKCRMGWKERSVVEVESKSGVLVAPATMTPEEWIKQATARTADKKEPGTEDE